MPSASVIAAEQAFAAAHANLLRAQREEAEKDIASFGEIASPVRDSNGKEHTVAFLVNPRQQKIPARAAENIHVQMAVRDFISSHPVSKTAEIITHFSAPHRRDEVLRKMPEWKKQRYTLNEHLRYAMKELLRVGTLHRVLV
jgi:hypothetical protein